MRNHISLILISILFCLMSAEVNAEITEIDVVGAFGVVERVIPAAIIADRDPDFVNMYTIALPNNTIYLERGGTSEDLLGIVFKTESSGKLFLETQLPGRLVNRNPSPFHLQGGKGRQSMAIALKDIYEFGTAHFSVKNQKGDVLYGTTFYVEEKC